MKKAIFLLALILIAGCNTLRDIQWVTPKKVPPINLTQNQSTNVTSSNVTIEYVEGGNFYFVTKNTVVVVANNSAVVIDSGGYDAVSILKKYDIKPRAIIITVDEHEKTQGVKEVILSMKPQLILDNGLPTDTRKDYLRYQDKLNITSVRINKHHSLLLPDIQLEFFVPFETHGFFDDKDMNSIVVRANNLLYMSNCYGACEQYIDDAEVDFLVLANHGICNKTTSLEFILDVGATTVFGENELCGELTDLNYFDVEFKKIENVVGVEDE